MPKLCHIGLRDHNNAMHYQFLSDGSRPHLIHEIRRLVYILCRLETGALMIMID